MSTPFKFFMHRTERDAIVDSSDSDEVNEDNPLSYWSVSAHRKIDVNKLKSLVKTITLKEFAEQCSTGIDGFFLARQKSIRESHQLDRLRALEDVTGIPIFRDRKRLKEGENPLLAPVFFNPHYADTRGFIKMPFNTTNARKVYKDGEDKKCVIWLYPYRSYDLVGRLKHLTRHYEKAPKHENARTLLSNDDLLVANVLKGTPRPKNVQNIVNEFTNEILGGSDYIALHWRYDKDDWYLHCERLANSTASKFHPQKSFDVCRGVAEVPIGTLMGRFDSFLANMTESGLWQSNTLYIASPVTQIKIILHMKRALEERFNRRVLTTVDALKFLRTKYAACNPKTLDYDLHDLLSLSEMELCSNARVFVRSGGSSWSFNVEQERYAKLNSFNDTTNTFLISGDLTDMHA